MNVLFNFSFWLVSSCAGAFTKFFPIFTHTNVTIYHRIDKHSGYPSGNDVNGNGGSRIW